MVKMNFLMALLSAATLSAQSQELSRVHIYNEYDTLKEVIVGTANTLYFPESHEIETEVQATGIIKFLSKRIYPMFKGKKVPDWIARKYRNEEAALIQVLQQQNVIVHRPDDVVPLPDEVPGLGQMFARDPIISLDNLTIDAQLQIAMRQKENRGFASLLTKLSANGISVKALRATDAFLEGGDVIVDYPYIFVGQGKYASNQKGIDWLRSIVGNTFEIVPVEITDHSVLHLDCALTLIGNKRGILHRKSLQHPLPKPLDSYDWIEVDDRTAKQLGTNVLMINPTTIILQKRHTQLIKDLKVRNYNVIPLKFTWHTRLGGAFRCATSPIDRALTKK